MAASLRPWSHSPGSGGFYRFSSAASRVAGSLPLQQVADAFLDRLGGVLLRGRRRRRRGGRGAGRGRLFPEDVAEALLDCLARILHRRARVFEDAFDRLRRVGRELGLQVLGHPPEMLVYFFTELLLGKVG